MSRASDLWQNPVLFFDVFVMMADFIIEREGCRIITTDLWWKGNVRHKKTLFYDGFGFVINIFVIKVDISSSGKVWTGIDKA